MPLKIQQTSSGVHIGGTPIPFARHYLLIVDIHGTEWLFPFECVGSFRLSRVQTVIQHSLSRGMRRPDSVSIAKESLLAEDGREYPSHGFSVRDGQGKPTLARVVEIVYLCPL